MGRGFAESLSDILQRYTLAEFPPTINNAADTGFASQEGGFRFTGQSLTAAVILGRVFWRVFLRGGIQAAEWLCETVLDEGPEGANVQCLVRNM